MSQRSTSRRWSATACCSSADRRRARIQDPAYAPAPANGRESLESLAITGRAGRRQDADVHQPCALALARDSRTPVFLIDLGLYRPTVASYLGMTFDKSDGLPWARRASTKSCTRPASKVWSSCPTGVRGPGVGVAGVANGRVRTHLELFAAHAVVRHAAAHAVDDVLVFSPRIDCVLDVVAVGVTERAALERSREILSELNVIGHSSQQVDGAGRRRQLLLH